VLVRRRPNKAQQFAAAEESNQGCAYVLALCVCVADPDCANIAAGLHACQRCVEPGSLSLDGALHPLQPTRRERRVQRECVSVGLDAGHDPHIAYGTTLQCGEGLLITRAIVYSDGVLN
jgi:hypothetical protein